MKHLKEGSIAYRVGRDRSITEVRIALQHPTLGAFFDSGRRVMQAWHGELHETREEAEDYVRRISRKTPVSDSGKIVLVR